MFRDLLIFIFNVFSHSKQVMWGFLSHSSTVAVYITVLRHFIDAASAKHQELGRLMSLARKVGQHMQEAVLQRNSLTTASGGKVNSCSKWRLASYPDNRRFAYCCQDEKRMSQCACQLMVSFVTSSVIGENRNRF